MSERFKKIPASQQESILQAALYEFAEKGYLRASTNAIVQTAGIPKGTLFYFFGSKKDLFLYVLDTAVTEYVTFVEKEKENVPEELFERLLHRQQIKLRFAAVYPLQFRFFSKVFLDIPEEIKEELNSRFQQYIDASADDLAQRVDTTHFREDVDIQAAIRMVHFLLEGILARYTPRLKTTAPENLDALIKEISVECRGHFSMIQKGIYR